MSEDETRLCSICGEILQPDEIAVCDDCKASILTNENIPPNLEDI